jgi:predicted permease
MLDVLAQMAALLMCGIGWRLVQPMGLDADATRRAITGLVFALLLPALVLRVLWQAPLGKESLILALIAATGVLFSVLLSWLIYRAMGVSRAVVGTMIIAASWPNATYLGLPVLTETLGEWAQSVAIQYDLFACTPLLLTLGVLLARAHGEDQDNESPWMALLKVPPLWAALAGVLLNIGEVEMTPWTYGVLDKLGMAVPSLMLIAVGMGLRWDTMRWSQLRVLAPVAVIQLALTPLLAFWLTRAAELSEPMRLAITLEAAMPTMVLGVVLCDRYRLDSGLYAAAVTFTTLLSLFILPLWHAG